MIIDKLLIINRVKEAKNFRSDKELSSFLGITPQSLSTWKARNSIDYDLIFTKCEEINPTWLLTGKGEMLLTTPIEVVATVEGKTIPIEVYEQALHQLTEERNRLKEAHKENGVLEFRLRSIEEELKQANKEIERLKNGGKDVARSVVV